MTTGHAGMDADSPLAWTIGLGAVGVTILYMSLLGDPILAYLVILTAVMALFPTYRPILTFLGLYGVIRISVRHDPVTGDYMSCVMAMSEAINTTVGGTAMVVTVMALWPTVMAALSLDLGAVKDAFAPAFPLVAIVCTKYFVEMQADADLMQLLSGTVDHARDFAKNLRAFMGVFTT